jgi:signal transduction histidine kinase
MTNKPIVTFLILFLFIAPPVQAQTSPIDSLQGELNAYVFPAVLQPKDTAYLLTTSHLCNLYFREFELDSMINKATKTLALLDQYFKDIKDPEVVRRLELYKMQFFKIRGMAKHQNGDYVGALNEFQQQLILAEKLASLKDIGSSYTNIALCHRELEDYTLAFQYAQKSVALLKDTPYKTTLANNYTIYSSYYNQELSNIDSAIIFAKCYRQIYSEAKLDMHEAGANFDIANLFADKYEPDSMMYYLQEMKDFTFSHQNPDLQIRYHTLFGRALLIKGDIQNALSHLSLATTMAEEEESPVFKYNTQKIYCLALAANGQYLQSLKSVNAAFDAYTDDLDSEKTRALTTNQLNFEFEKKEALAKLELQKQARIRNISLIGFLLGLIVALLLYRLYRQSKKVSRLLTEKNAQIEKSYQELKATQEQLILTEKQREAQSIRVNIARDIHDELGAGLTKITMMSDFVRKKLPAEQGEIAQMLQRITENSKGVSDALGEIVWAVNPSHDTLESLSSYLKNYSAHYLEGTGIKGEYDFPINILPRNVEPALKRNVFLVLKEALNNAVKYANADTIWVTFITEGNTFKLSIRDNGVGFNPEEKSQNGGSGNGLVNMKKRMELLGCQYNIQSETGKGCTISAFGNI